MQIENASGSRVERLEGIEGLCGSDAQCPIDLTGDDDLPHSSSAGHSSDAEDLDRLSVENGEPSSGPSRDADNELDDEEDTGDAAARTPWNVEQSAVLRPRVVQQAVVSDYQNEIEVRRPSVTDSCYVLTISRWPDNISSVRCGIGQLCR
mgnify:CR=1 FL=1